jgi:hypothetical protein
MLIRDAYHALRWFTRVRERRHDPQNSIRGPGLCGVAEDKWANDQ